MAGASSGQVEPIGLVAFGPIKKFKSEMRSSLAKCGRQSSLVWLGHAVTTRRKVFAGT